ncbi:MAG TPA: hypothetical protein DC042_04515, partial [Bacteroidales bacterium]|nr:hypothetical protein [Bacteroidales bacterium]
MRTFLVFLVLVLTGCQGGTGIRLVSGGKSDYVIRIPDNPAPQEERAAWFLQTYVKKISGAEIPVVEGLNHLPEKSVVIQTGGGITNSDGFSVTTMGDRLTILGGNHKGC